METEENLIPYHVTDLTGHKVLSLAPHPDDETIGCGGSLIHHVEAGDAVKVVFLTNGAKGDTSGEMEEDLYVGWRASEAKNACAHLGVTDLEFWAFEDRALAGSQGVLRRLIQLLREFQPQLVYAPSPMEIHPDHRATCFLLADAIRSTVEDFRLAFYEVGQPVSVNVLVDITPVLARRVRAMEAYESQLKERPYKDASIALNRYRSITLPRSVTHAEGFFVCDADLLRKVGPFSLPFQRVNRLRPLFGETGPLVSVIVRTKDRPGLLSNALCSVVKQTYANIEIVLVNDGGADVKDMAHMIARDVPVNYITHEESRGRAAAANSGLQAAHGLYLNFLDDDDVLYPEHVENLVQRLEADCSKVAYSSVLSAFYKGPPERPESCTKRVVHHDIDFDPRRLLFQNFIPIMSVLFHRDVLSKVGAFDETLDLFEDWDFWIRMSRHFRFHHIHQVTAEYRFYGSETTEASHHRKYRYTKARAEMFERITPFLEGETWINLLDSNWFDELRRVPEEENTERQLKQMEAALEEVNQKLKAAQDLIHRLSVENQMSRSTLDAIQSSRGWRWLCHYGRLKRRLRFRSPDTTDRGGQSCRKSA